MDNLVILGHKFSEHAKSSGYCRLADFIPDAKIYMYERDKEIKLPQKAIAAFFRTFAETRWLTYDSIQRQWASIFESSLFSRKKKLFHFLYAENGFYWAARYAKKMGNVVCATFHGTPELLESIFRHTKPFDYLDGVILMSKTQLDYFRKINYRGRIFVIPYGIDTQYFNQPERKFSNELVTCLVTGSFERDYETVRKVIETIEQGDAIQFVVVSSPEICRQFSAMKNVKAYSHIEDDELLKLYRDSDIFLHVVKSSTTNTALLEALSCGLPIVTVNVGGIQEYITPSCAICCDKGNILEIKNALIDLSRSAELRNKMSIASRQRALELDWRNVSKLTLSAYQELLSKNASPHHKFRV